MKVAYEDNHKFIDGIENKLCRECKEWKPMNTDYFYINKTNGTDGFHTWCKDCSRKKAKKVRNDNIDRYREKTYQHYQENKEQYDNRRKQWMEDNSEYRKQYYRDYQKNNKEYFSEYFKVRQMNKRHEISKEEWKECLNYFNYSCAYCGMSEKKAKEIFNKKLHKEHVDHEGSNDLSNAIPACTGCNSSKWAHPMEEWYTNMGFYSEERLSKINQWLKVDYKIYIK